MSEATTAVELYNQGVSIAAICARIQRSRPMVYIYLKQAGIKPYRRSSRPNQTNCYRDGCINTVTRWRSNRSVRPFCSQECYFAFRRSSPYREWRQGTRIARFTVTETGFDLRPGMVVHHLDHDETNNNLTNLAVFQNNSDHLSFHHGLDGHAQPLARFDGKPIPKRVRKVRRTYYAKRVTKSNTPSDSEKSVTNGNDPSLVVRPAES